MSAMSVYVADQVACAPHERNGRHRNLQPESSHSAIGHKDLQRDQALPVCEAAKMAGFRLFVRFYGLGASAHRVLAYHESAAVLTGASQRRVRQSSSTATVSEHPAMSSEVTNEPVRYRVTITPRPSRTRLAAFTRHQMTTRVKLGAKRDGTLTAIEARVVSNTGAYGGHAGETLAASLASPLTMYRCANKKAGGYAVYTNVVPGGGFRGYGSSQTTFAIESAMDDLAKQLGLDPYAIRRTNMIRQGDWMESIWSDPSDVDFGSYGLDQCMDRVEEAMASGRGDPKPEGEDWLEGTGIALAMLESGPPTEHRSGAEMRLLVDGTYHLAVGSTEMGNGSVTSHRQLAAGVLGCRAGQIAIINADTDRTPFDTGTFASAGTVVAGQAVALTAASLRDNILEYASRHTRVVPAACKLEAGAVLCGNHRITLAALYAAGVADGHRFIARRRAYLAPRTVAFNVQGIRLAVHRVTAEIRILYSVHAADIGRLINPMQCRGQIDGSISMGLDWALTENMVHDVDGTLVNPSLRNYRIPSYADTPVSEVIFADTYDQIGPLGAKAQGECAINPVAPAIAKALANATGVRFAHLPLTPDRIFAALGVAG